MSIDVLREFLLWSTVVNFAVLLPWFAAYLLGHDLLKEDHVRWYLCRQRILLSRTF